MSNQTENEKKSDIIYELGETKIVVRRTEKGELIEFESKQIPMSEVASVISILQTLRQERNIPYFKWGG